MDSEESLFNHENVEMAILQFFRDPTNDVLNDYLTRARLSQSAWTFVWALLSTGKPTEIQFYGASTLHLKISKHWHEIPVDLILPLRDRLFQVLAMYSDDCLRVVFKKLCVCLGCFILQTVTRQWPNAFYELVSSVINPPGNDPKEKGVCRKNLLEILRTIPEEFLSPRLPLSEKTRVVNDLLNASDTVYELINKVLAEDWPEELKVAAVKCFTSWCHSDICQFQPDNESLLIHLFNLLKSQKHSIEAADALAQFFKLLPNPNNSRILKYLQLVTELVSIFDHQSHNIDFAQSLTKVFLSAAENNMELLLFSIALGNEHSATSLDLLRLILRTVAIEHQYPTEELCSDLSLDFWLTLQSKVMDAGFPPLIVEVVTSLLLKLLEILTAKIRYPPENLYSQWEEEDKEQFLGYRRDLADLAGNITVLLGSQSMNLMVQILKHQIHNNLGAEWQDFESIFFIMTSLLENDNIPELDCISEIYALMSQIPCNHLTLTEETIMFVGNSSEKVDDELFDQSVGFVLNFFNQKALLAAASKSLRDVLATNTERIARVSEGVIQGIKQAMERPDSESSIRKTLANCLGFVVSVIPQDLAFRAIQVILMPHINVLCNLAVTTQVSSQDQSIGTEKLKIMANFFSAFSVSNEDISSYSFIFEFVSFILPYVGKMITSNIRNEVFMLEIFKFLKVMAFSLVPHFGRMASNFCEIIPVTYDVNPLPCVLDFAETLFSASKAEGKYTEELRSMYLFICERSLQVMGQNPSDHPDLLKSFMRFLSKSIKVKNFIKLEENLLLTLFRTAMRGVELTEIQASRSSLQFLNTFILNNDFSQIVKTEGQRLLEILLLAVAVKFPIQDLHHVADVLMALRNKHRQFVVETLTVVLSPDNFPIPVATQSEKEHLLRIISDSGVTEKKVNDALKELALIWRDISDPDGGGPTMYLG